MRLPLLGAIPLEEIAAPQSIVAEETTPFVTRGGEELPVFPIGEDGVFAAVAADDVATLPTRGEDFAGSLPQDEASAVISTSPPGDDVAWVSRGEDFAGSLVFEDVASAFGGGVDDTSMSATAPRVSGEDIAPIVIPPAALEEAGASLWLPSDDASSAPPRGEDFAGSLPAEEAGRIAFIVDSDSASLSTLREDFAGSLPLEETAVTPLLFLDDVTPLTSRGEDFAGSLPLEEGGAFVFVADVDVVSMPPLREDFAGALPLEEASSFVFFTSPPSDSPLSISEEVVANLLVEEPSYGCFRILQDDLLEDPPFEDFFLAPSPPPPPPPPPPPAPPVTTPQAGGGGGGGYIDSYSGFDHISIDRIVRGVAEKRQQRVDYALMPLETEGAVKAVASGVVTYFVDARGKQAALLSALDGTRYYYANLGRRVAASGARVNAGDVIAYVEKMALLPPPEAPKAPPKAATMGVLPIARGAAVAPKPPPPAALQAPSLGTVITSLLRATLIIGAVVFIVYIVSKALPGKPRQLKTKRRRRLR